LQRPAPAQPASPKPATSPAPVPTPQTQQPDQPAKTAINANLKYALECGAAKSTPPDNDPDPIYKTKIAVTDQGMYVVHYAASGKTFIRNEQYRDQRFWPQEKTANWSGISVKHPDWTMVGSIRMDKESQWVEYTEKLFRGGKLTATTVSVCGPIATPGGAHEIMYAAISNWECGHLVVTVWKTVDKEPPILYRVSIAEAVVPYFGAVTWDEQANKVFMNGKACQELRR